MFTCIFTERGNFQMAEKKQGFTPMMWRYVIKFTIRIIIFFTSLVFYLLYRDWATAFLQRSFFTIDIPGISAIPGIRFGLTPIHGLWAIFMTLMIIHIFFNGVSEKLTMALRKSKKQFYVPVENYDHYELLKFVQKQNVAAWTVMLVWLSFNAIFGILYLTGILAEADLLMLTIFYFLCDYICILIFCPFQTVIMKNKCCVNCRIYDWGHFMMFTPMLFIKSFFSWSLFFTSLVVLIRWEIVYAKHPEWFWEGSNQVLKCANCQDRTCRIKKAVRPGK
jgi:hypothetical protein